jgi:preprotein translocase subunit SecY
MGEYPYIVFYILLIYFFSYFWTTIVFSPEDMARQLRDNGSFIPGLRPGPRTAEYLETVVERITYVGAGFLAVIAVIPSIVSKEMQIPFFVSSFLGGTGLLIVVSVGLDLIQRIEANLLMRNYKGFHDAPVRSRSNASSRRPSSA